MLLVYIKTNAFASGLIAYLIRNSVALPLIFTFGGFLRLISLKSRVVCYENSYVYTSYRGTLWGGAFDGATPSSEIVECSVSSSNWTRVPIHYVATIGLKARFVCTDNLL